MNWFVSLCQQNTQDFYSHQVESKEAFVHIVRVIVPLMKYYVKRSKVFTGKLTNQVAMLGMNAYKAVGRGSDTKLQHGWSGSGGCRCCRWCDTVAEHDATLPSGTAFPSHTSCGDEQLGAGR